MEPLKKLVFLFFVSTLTGCLSKQPALLVPENTIQEAPVKVPEEPAEPEVPMNVEAKPRSLIERYIDGEIPEQQN